MAEAMPDIPEYISQEMDAAFGADARFTVRGQRRPPDEGDPPRGQGEGAGRLLDREALDAFHTLLAGVSIAVVAATCAIGLLFVWLAAPGLAYTLLAVAGSCAIGWAVYYPLARRAQAASRGQSGVR